jgi:hypothetical protein
MPHSSKNSVFGVWLHNSPHDFSPKCMIFEPLNAINLHLFALKKLENLIWRGSRLFQEALITTKE